MKVCFSNQMKGSKHEDQLTGLAGGSPNLLVFRGCSIILCKDRALEDSSRWDIHSISSHHKYRLESLLSCL